MVATAGGGHGARAVTDLAVGDQQSQDHADDEQQEDDDECGHEDLTDA